MCMNPMDRSRDGVVRDQGGNVVPPMPQPDRPMKIQPSQSPKLLGDGAAKKAARDLRSRQLKIDQAVDEATK